MEQKVYSFFRPYREAPDLRHIDVLDGVRVICVALVAWYHFWQQGWLFPRIELGSVNISLAFLSCTGYVWVDGMLLLSGLLLYLPYAQAGSKLPRALPFYKRRLIRILPSYLLCVLPMFVIACVQGVYQDASAAALDLAAHLTFTFNLFPFTYFRSPINGALWTLAVEMQFYLLFPLLSRCFRKLPALTYCLMTAAALAFRYYAALQPDSSMYFNQLPAFLDVYAQGFAAAAVITALRKKLGSPQDRFTRLFFTVMAGFCAALIVPLLQAQVLLYESQAIRLGQMTRRFPLTLMLSCFCVCISFSCAAFRFALGNRVMRFLASVSYQFYIYHQLLAVRIRKWGLVPSASKEPWRAADFTWQVTYTLLCYLLALLLATLLTYLFELPVTRRLRGRLKA
ncbi:MAG: acyltransferase [Clostridia bacterium]|nr:acyltransferase [Clostridia bacterium]